MEHRHINKLAKLFACGCMIALVGLISAWLNTQSPQVAAVCAVFSLLLLVIDTAYATAKSENILTYALGFGASMMACNGLCHAFRPATLGQWVICLSIICIVTLSVPFTGLFIGERIHQCQPPEDPRDR